MTIFKQNRVPEYIFKLSTAAICLLPLSASLFSQSQISERETEIITEWLQESINNVDESTLASSVLLTQSRDFGISAGDFLSAANNLDVSNISLLVSLILHCDSEPSISNCETSRQIEKLKLLDNENSMPLVLSALHLESQGYSERALSELELASGGVVHEDYFLPRAEFLSETLRSLDYSEDKIYEHAFQYSGIDFLGVYHSLTVTCEKYVRASKAWKNACIDIGKKMEDYGRTFISVRTGIAIQRSMYAFDSTDQHLLEAVQRRSAFTHRWRVLRAEHLDELLLISGDQYYIDHFEKDEVYAVNRAFVRLSGVPDPDPFLRRNPEFQQQFPN